MATSMISSIDVISKVGLTPWAILIGAWLTWIYYRQKNVADLYQSYYRDLMVPRISVDTWLSFKSRTDLDELYRGMVETSGGPVDASSDTGTNQYYNILKFKMFMHHICVIHEQKKLWFIHFMVDPKLFRETFKPNIANYYLKLIYFIYHRKNIHGHQHPQLYFSFENLALRYIGSYARQIIKSDDKLKQSIPAKKLGRESLRKFLRDNAEDMSRRVLDGSLKRENATSAEHVFVEEFLRVYAEAQSQGIASPAAGGPGGLPTGAPGR
jgi:hypothetical protein